MNIAQLKTTDEYPSKQSVALFCWRNGKVRWMSVAVELPLRGLLKCSNCDGSMTGSPSRSRSGKKYFYYHCNICKKTRFRSDEANEKMESVLNCLTPSEDIITLYREMLIDALGQKTKKTTVQLTSLKDKLNTLQTRLLNLQDMFADKQISVSEYQNLKSKYEVQLVEVKSEMTDINGNGKNIEQLIENGIKQLSQLNKLYSEVSLERKSRLLGSIFPEKFFFENKKYRTTNLNQAILLYLNIDKGLREKKTGQLSEFLELSGSVQWSRQRSNLLLNDLKNLLELV